ncbi:MAG: hypothetical protein COW03_10040 [Cytophagales bacterium CG12_big_fil_rev_8_21_14_0_65_40_12]|nr:MAG: hypothetical protein COW03_10040 [Cytophagales bacterium CG12_big_fil_rev_8_21_14_0_65_40_12]PIW03764.1 MAG: hypothetical protein COW40_13090 [Cytophagales bacterium CG17_big_fil_post_rev_8_21_14_2_50_40_13]
MRNLKVVEQASLIAEKQFAQILYTSKTFLEVNNNLPQIHFWLMETTDQTALGHVSFSLEEGKALSPAKAPFGGFSLADSLKSEELTFFIFEVIRKLKNLNISAIYLKSAPDNYGIHLSVLNQNLVYAGFSGLKDFEYQSIMVTDEAFDSKIAEMENRKLKKCEKEGFEFKLLSQNHLHAVFQFVKAHRDEKGYDFSMDWESLKMANLALPNIYLPMAVFDGPKMIAATIAIRAIDKVLYNFSPAHDWDYHQFSPVVMLTQGLYHFCQTNGFTHLDLGTSYLDDAINEGLKSFKSRLGAETFFGHSYHKILSSH